MRISDWSSDVCSSDLIPLLAPGCRIEDDMRGELQRLLQRHDLLRRPVARHRKVHKLEAPGCQLGKAPTDPRLHHRLESLALLAPPAHAVHDAENIPTKVARRGGLAEVLVAHPPPVRL